MVLRVAVVAGFAATVMYAQQTEDYGPHLHWDGILAGRTEISVQAWTVVVRGSASGAVGPFRYQITRPLSDGCDQDVRLVVHNGNGLQVTQQPRKENQHVAVILIEPSKPSRVSFDLHYRLYPHSWFDAPSGWWEPRDVVRWRSNGSGSIIVTCRDRRCAGTARSGHTPRFDFAPGLPKSESLVTLTEPQPNTLPREDRGVRVLEKPSKKNNYATRVAINLTESRDYGFTLTWSSLLSDGR